MKKLKNLMTLMLLCLTFAMIMTLFTGCTIDGENYGDIDSEVISTNQLSASQLASSKAAASAIGDASLGSNSAAEQALVATADGRATMAVTVGCALPAGASITVGGFVFSGSLGLAPLWQTNASSSSDRRWTTACVLARTNLYGLSVPIALRHDTNPALASTSTERVAYSNAEAGFYGDMFVAPPSMYACASQLFTPGGNAGLESVRACARSSNGVTTQCGFTYSWLCGATLGGHARACTDGTAPYGACRGGVATLNEVVTSFAQS